MIGKYLIELIHHIYPLCVIMILMFIVDTYTGVLKAKVLHNFSSSKLRSSLPKFLIYFGIVTVCISVDFMSVYYLNNIEFDIPNIILRISNLYPVTILCKVFIIVVEMISILENGKEAGLKIPKFLMKILNKIENTIEASIDDVEDNVE